MALASVKDIPPSSLARLSQSASPVISHGPPEQLPYNNSSSSTFKPIKYITSSTLPSSSSPLPSDSVCNPDYKFIAHNNQQNQQNQLPGNNIEFQKNIEMLTDIERQQEIERLQKIERQLKFERLQQIQQIDQQRKIDRFHRLEHQKQMDGQDQIERLHQVQCDNRFGQDEQVIEHEQSAQEQQLKTEQEARYTKSQILYGQWLLRQRQLDPIPRPWTIWAIGIIDILSIVPSVGLVAYDLFTKPLADPTTHLWTFFKVSVFTVIQLMMGIGLLNGLRSKDDSSTLWYCKMWIWCESIFIVDSTFTLFSTLILAAQSTHLPDNFTTFYTAQTLKGAFRLISLILLIRFTNKLKESQRVFKDAYKKQQEILMHEQQQNAFRNGNPDAIRNYNEQRNSAGGDVIGPYVAVVLGL